MPPPGSAALSYLPLAHLAERMFSHYLAIDRAATVTFIQDHQKMDETLPLVRPHVFLRDRAATEANPVKRALTRAALTVANSRGRAPLEQRTPEPTRLLHPILDRLVYARIRRALGLDRVQMAASGAAPLSAEVVTFFAGIGIPITEAYGMTETSAVLTVTPLAAPRPGTVGTALPGIELRIADDGEMLARGPNITPGYLNRPDATAETIDPAGWLHTGDLGTPDADGYLTITGRKKELIINAAGKNISPANIELAITGESDLLGPVYVHGDRRPYLVALLTLDPLSWSDWCRGRGITATTPADAATHPVVGEEAARAVRAANLGLARVEQIKAWQLLDHVWDTATGELTPTLKLKRTVVADRYDAELDALYARP